MADTPRNFFLLIFVNFPRGGRCFYLTAQHVTMYSFLELSGNTIYKSLQGCVFLLRVCLVCCCFFGGGVSFCFICLYLMSLLVCLDCKFIRWQELHSATASTVPSTEGYNFYWAVWTAMKQQVNNNNNLPHFTVAESHRNLRPETAMG